MKTTIITASRQKVFERVARQMDWLGLRGSESAEEYGRVAISEADTVLLHSFFDEAAMHAIDICRPFLQSVRNTDDSLELTLTVSDHCDQSMRDGLAPILFNLLSMHVLRQWLEIVDSGRTEGCASRLRDADTKLLGALYHHTAPVRVST